MAMRGMSHSPQGKCGEKCSNGHGIWVPGSHSMVALTPSNTLEYSLVPNVLSESWSHFKIRQVKFWEKLAWDEITAILFLPQAIES